MATKIADLTSVQLSELTRLITQKEKLQAQLAALNVKIESVGGDIGDRKRGLKPGRKGGRRGPKPGTKPGKLKATVLAALGAAANGLTVKELSEKIKVKPSNLYSWFYTTGRKVAGLKKSGEKYSYAAK